MKQTILGVLIILSGFFVAGCSGDSPATPPPPAALSTSKAITAFSFTTPAATGTVTEATHSIAVTVPFGTVVTALVPTIVHTGVSVSPLSGVAQDFTAPFNYTVTAEDGTTQQYTVTVTVRPKQSFSAWGQTSYVVPAGVTSINVKMWGAGGIWSGAGNGGAGGYVSGTIATTPGETLTLRVARAPFSASLSDYYTGGYGGGGNGNSVSNQAGGGGGASWILRGATVLMVAGGGGGAGNGGGIFTSDGGAGGGLTGAVGGNGGQGTNMGGGGGTQAAGGAGGAGVLAGSAGSLGQGGSSNLGCNEAGGGGGGGYYGGGAGGGDTATTFSGAGGGGGSSYTHPTDVASAVNTAGSGMVPGNSADADRGTAGRGGDRSGIDPGDGLIVIY